MVKVKVQGIEKYVPTEWSEVTVKQYRELVNHSAEINPCRVLSILLDIPYDVLINADTQEMDTALLGLINFIATPIDFKKLPRPNKLPLLGAEYDVPEDIKQCTYGQKVVLQMKVQAAVAREADLSELISTIIAIYMQPKIKGKFDDKESELLETHIDLLPVVLCFPIADFFLRSYMKYLKPKANS